MAETSIHLRIARYTDISLLQPLVQRAVSELLAPFLSAEQIRATREIMGLDTQLVADGTYFIAEFDGELGGCGGWSRRATHFGGDHSPGRDARSLYPIQEPARIRAMYTHPEFARRGVGRAILARCEAEAAAEGFKSMTLVATMAGVPLYLACGYEEFERFEEITPSGIAVTLVRMRRQLCRQL